MLDMIGDRLKELRVGANMSQPECAAIVGTSKQYVSQLESGKNKTPNGEFLEAWARHFRVHHRWLASGIGPKWASESSQPVDDSSMADQVAELKRHVESLTIALAGFVSITAEHRPLEGEDLARVIRESRLLDLSQHELVGGFLKMLDRGKAAKKKTTAVARTQSPG